MPHIFISYSHKDKEYACLLANELGKHGIEYWMDDRIDYGTQWPRIIQQNIESCAAVIVIMSTNAFDSNWVLNEVAFAQQERKTIFPVLLEGKSWVSLASSQYVDVRDGRLPPQSYFDAVASHANSTVPTTSPQPITVIELLEQIRSGGETVVSVESATELHQVGFPDTYVSGFLILTDTRLLFKPHDSNISLEISAFNLSSELHTLRDQHSAWDWLTGDYSLELIDPASNKIRRFSLPKGKMVRELQVYLPLHPL